MRSNARKTIDYDPSKDSMLGDFSAAYNHSFSSFGQVKSEKQRVLTLHPTGNHTQNWRFINHKVRDSPTKLKSVSRLNKQHAKAIEEKTSSLKVDILSQVINRESKTTASTSKALDDNGQQNIVREQRNSRRNFEENVARSSRLINGGPIILTQPSEGEIPIVQKLLTSLRSEERENTIMPLYNILHPLDQIRESKDFPSELLSEYDSEWLKESSDDEENVQRKMKSAPTLQYGRRWYVSSRKWFEMENTKVNEEIIEQQKDEEKVKHLANLGSSKMFKEYLLRSRKNVPIWLKDVPVSKELIQEPQESVIPSSLLHRHNLSHFSSL